MTNLTCPVCGYPTATNTFDAQGRQTGSCSRCGSEWEDSEMSRTDALGGERPPEPTKRTDLDYDIETTIALLDEINAGDSMRAVLQLREVVREQAARLDQLTKERDLAQDDLEGAKALLLAAKQAQSVLKAREQVLFDLHDAIGVKWGDDPYSALSSLRAQLRQAHHVVQTFLVKYDQVEPHIDGLFVTAYARSGQQYEGPDWGEELTALRALGVVPKETPDND